MTPEQAAWLQARIDEGLRRHDELVAQKQLDWPPAAFADPPALYIYDVPAMYAYYLGADGGVYSYDMDRFAMELHRVGEEKTIRDVYATAADKFPILEGLSTA